MSENRFELVHPPCVEERSADYDEGMTAWKAGACDEAREIFRDALDGCGQNIWIHLALGKMALQEEQKLELARGHLGYVIELANQALAAQRHGTLDIHSPANQPVFEAIECLIEVFKQLKQSRAIEDLNRLAHRFSGPQAES
jgi:hypothetical protein